MMKIRKKIVAYAMVAVLSLQSASISKAAVYIDYGLQSKNATVSEVSGFSDKWATIIKNAIKSWNNSGAGVKVAQSANPVSILEVNSYADSWYGLTQILQLDNGYISKAGIKINHRTISGDASNFNRFAQSTVAHEIGHLYWLADNPVESPAGYDMSLMNHGRNRNKIYEPQVFDVSNVKRKYSSKAAYDISDSMTDDTVNYISVDEPEYNKASKFVKAADILVSGTVAAQETKMLETGTDKEKMPYTIYKIEVKDKYKGDCSSTIYAKRLGGKIDGRDNILSGAADINVGESYVFALKDYGNGDYGFVNTTQSAMALKKSSIYEYGGINRKDVLALADTASVRRMAADEKIYGTEKELKKASDVVVIGEVIDYSYEVIEDNLYTIWKVKADRVEKGKEKSEIIYIKTLGGRKDTLISLVENMTKIECGNSYKFYLKDYGTDYYGLTNYSESIIKLRVVTIID